MGILTSNKYIGSASAACDGEFTVTLALSAVPSDISTSIAIVMQTSSSMAGEPLTQLKASVLELINALECSTNTEAAIVSYGSTAATVQPLTDDSSLLVSAVNQITASGNSNLYAGIEEAAGILSAVSGRSRRNQKIMIVFTDGSYDTGLDPKIAAESAKNAGITLYFVAVDSARTADLSSLDTWASAPSPAYVITDFSEDRGTFPYFVANLGRNLNVGGAENICVCETVAADFEIVSASAATSGTVTVTGQRTLTWNIGTLGTSAAEGAALTYTARHVGVRSGEKSITESTTFSDTAGNVAEFNSPEILIDCGQISYCDPCPEGTDTVSPACEEIIDIDAGAVSMGLMGRVARVSVTLRNVCPGRRIAVAVLLSELDSDGNEYQRGIRTLTVPAHSYATSRDIRLNCITFVLPEDIDPISSETFGERTFRTRVYANIIDSELDCCCREEDEALQ